MHTSWVGQSLDEPAPQADYIQARAHWAVALISTTSAELSNAMHLTLATIERLLPVSQPSQFMKNLSITGALLIFLAKRQ